MSDNIIFNCIPGFTHYSTFYSGNTATDISQAEKARTYSTVTLLALSCLATYYRPMLGALVIGMGFLSHRALTNIIDAKKLRQEEEIQSNQAPWIEEANSVSEWFEKSHPVSWDALLANKRSTVKRLQENPPQGRSEAVDTAKFRLERSVRRFDILKKLHDLGAILSPIMENPKMVEKVNLPKLKKSFEELKSAVVSYDTEYKERDREPWDKRAAIAESLKLCQKGIDKL